MAKHKLFSTGRKEAQQAKDRVMANTSNSDATDLAATTKASRSIADSSGFSRTGKSSALIARQQDMLASQARQVCYTKQVISNRTLEDTYWRKSIAAGRERPSEVVYLNPENLQSYILSEYRNFLAYLSHVLDETSELHELNCFIQEQYDGVTLPNGKKYLSQSLQFIALHPTKKDNTVLKNWNIAIGIQPCSSGEATATLAKLKETFKAIPTKAKVEQMIRCGVSDAAALSVMRLQMLEPEACLMHGGQKWGEAGVGRLTQSKNKEVLDPFPDGVRLQSLAHRFSTHFSYGTERIGKLHQFCDLLQVPKLQLAPDNCTTRISGLHTELVPIARMGPACVQYSNNEKLSAGLNEDDCEQAIEVESILREVKSQTTLAQHERAWTGAYR